MNRPDEVNLELGPDDQRVLDALADVGYDVDRLPRVDRARGQRIAELLALLEDYPVDDADDTLVHATLAGIDRHESQRLARMSFDHHQEEAAAADRGRRIRIPDFISVAAVLLIGAAIFWPTLSQVRQRSLATACSNNLRQLGYGFSQYAAANAGAMPVARAGSDLSWDMVANVLNLAPLLDGGYCERGHLSCPAVHEHDAVTGNYSYQWQLPGTRVQWGGGPGMTLVLGDRNPLIDAFRDGHHAGAMTISLNHGGRGQYVLGSDGATLWLETPVIGQGDNIWLPNGLDELRRGAKPSEPGDVFLAH